MKRTLLIILLLVNKLWAQNLISNPGFETFSSPPSGSGQYANAIGWTNCNGGGSPDYFSTLGSGLVQLPNCFIGTVNPHSGQGCMGAAFYYTSPGFREYLSIALSSPMAAGNKYDISFYISNGITSGTYGGGGIDNVSAAFSTNPLQQAGSGPISFTPQYTYGSVLYNKGWQLISFQFTADSSYQYFTLGNFKNDAATVYQQFDACSNPGAYYFFDDISVVKTASGIPPVAFLSASDSVMCANDCISFNNLSSNATSWKWIFDGALPQTSTDTNPQLVCYLSPGTYNVKLIATNGNSSDSITFANYITVASAPPTPAITQYHDTLICSFDSSYTDYQWFNGTTLIQGATGPMLIVTKGGNYNVQVSNKTGCKIAVGITIVLAVNRFKLNDPVFEISPNPVRDQLKIRNVAGKEHIVIYNMLGMKLYSSTQEALNSKEELEIDVSHLPSGIYLIEAVSINKRQVARFLKD